MARAGAGQFLAMALGLYAFSPPPAVAEDCLPNYDNYYVCTAARQVERKVSDAVAAAEACLNGQPACPAYGVPDTTVVDELVAQVYGAAEACLNGAPGCPAPMPDPGPYADLVEQLTTDAVALAEACIASEPSCPVTADLGPVHELQAQVMMIAQACLNGAPGCPAPAPSSAPQSIGLGGYRYCVTSDFALNGYGVGPITPLVSTEYGAQGSASAQCTKDSTGQSGWINATLTFQGSEDGGSLPCTAWGTGEYRIVGSLWLNDGTANIEAPAVLSISASYVDQSVAVNFDLASHNMRSSLQVFDVQPESGATPTVPAVTGNACYEWTLQQVHASGSLDILPSAVSVAAAHAGLDDVEGYSVIVPPEIRDNLPTPVKDRVPAAVATDPPEEVPIRVPRMRPDGVGQVQEIDEALAQSLGLIMQTIGDALTPGVAPPLAPGVTDTTPYMVRVRYRTSFGSGTTEALGVPGVPTRVIVPNYNNSNIPEYLEISVSLDTEGGRSSVSIDRQPNACVPFPIDVAVIAPPVEQVQTIAGVKVEVGYEGFSVGGGAPRTFQFALAQTSSDESEASSATVRMTHCASTGLPVDVVGRYVNQADKNDLTLRMHMLTPVTQLSLASTTQGKKRTLAYLANRPVDTISVTGVERGFEFNARLDDVAPDLSVCSDAGSSCLLPSRVYQCGCDAYWGGWRWFRVCTKPRYCPIPVDTSVLLTAQNRLGGYYPTTFNLRSHSPDYDDSGNLAGDTISTVTDATFSQFAVDSWTGAHPKHVFIDTRNQMIRGTLETKKVDANGLQKDYSKLSFDYPGVTAWDRLATIKRHKIVFNACWPFNCRTEISWLTFHTSGGMNCIGEFHLDTDGEHSPAPWEEDFFTYAMCGY